MTFITGEGAVDVAAEEELRRAADAATGLERLLLLTRVARVAGLRRRYAEAHSLLDQVEAGRRTWGQMTGAERMVAGGWAALERGRLHAATGSADRAQEHFEDAAVLARESSADDLLVESLHLQAAVEPMPHFAVRLHRQALRVARGSEMAAVRAREEELRAELARGYRRAGRPDEAAETLAEPTGTEPVVFPVQE